MKVSPVHPIYETIREDYVNTAVPKLIAEWNLNRYCNPIAENIPFEDLEGFDIELFPIDSIIEPNRPTSGINKALVDQAFVTPSTRVNVPISRYYLTSVDDVYKYWLSPYPTNGSSVFPVYPGDGQSSCRPTIAYLDEDGAGMAVQTNKIVVCTELGPGNFPNSWTIKTMAAPAGVWVTVATNPAVDENGLVELWWNGSAWTSTPHYGPQTTPIHGIQVQVNSMTSAPNTHFALIELGARLELDLSADLTEASDSMSLGEADFITPLGTVSSNTASVSLFNEHRKYTNSNGSSVLFNILDQGVRMNLSYVYTVEGTDYEVQQFEMFSDTWEENFDETTVSLTDFSKYLMETKPHPVLYQNITVSEAVWRICDMIGFNGYDVIDFENTNIDIFWTTGEETVWEVFQELSRGTQTAIYFDCNGRLQIRSRASAFQSGNPTADWVAREVKSGDELPDIITLDSETQYESNKITVNYQPTGFSDTINGITAFETVWEPDGVVALRANPLMSDINDSQTNMYFGWEYVYYWPYEGMFQIEGEWVKYRGKGIYYADSDGNRAQGVIYSDAELWKLYYEAPEDKRHLFNWDGRIYNMERGVYNTIAMAHTVSPMGRWGCSRRVNYDTTYSNVSGFVHNLTGSSVTLMQSEVTDKNDYKFAHRGSAADQGFYYYGTRMKLDNTAHRRKTAGIWINGDTFGAGYFLEITATSAISAKERATQNEVMLYSIKSNGDRQAFGGQKAVIKDASKPANSNATVKIDTGTPVAIVLDRYFDVDIKFKIEGTSHRIMVFINGILSIDTVIPAGPWKRTWCGRWGMFVRGHSQATWEYIYAINNLEIEYDATGVFRNMVEGGYKSDQWMQDWVYDTRTARRKVKKKWTKVQQRYSQRFFDEFGPILHEIREFDTKFTTELPVLQSKLYNTNIDKSIVVEYIHGIMGSKFIIANAARENCILNGEDTLIFPGGGAVVEQALLVYGRPVIQKEAASIVKKDDWAIRRRGVIETEYQSKWIQNEAEAIALAEWLTTNWSRSDSTLTVEVFGNPLIELCDIVSVQYESLLPATHKYYVVGVSTSYSNGINTTLTLRRVTLASD